jgi:hypothetical protein
MRSGSACAGGSEAASQRIGELASQLKLAKVGFVVSRPVSGKEKSSVNDHEREKSDCI